ncbi:TPA: transposase [Escherichia coli]|nr:transposase [Escherichia coli]
MSLPNPLYVDTDVSKTTLDIAASNTTELFSVASSADGFDFIIAELRQHDMAYVLMEATGGLEAAVACALQAEGFEIAVVTPRQARDFVRAMGYLAKTDRIDARAFAQMAEVINRHPKRDRFIRALPDADRQVLNAIVVRRRQLIAMPVTERNRLYPPHPQSKKTLISSKRWKMPPHIRNHFKEPAEHLSNIKGMGVMTTAVLVACMRKLLTILNAMLRKNKEM